MSEIKRFDKKNPDINQKIKVSLKFKEIEGFLPIVHAVHDKSVFDKILTSKSILLPNEHNFSSRVPFIEKDLGYNNSIFFSAGFGYSVDYGFSYGFIFDSKILKELAYYKHPLAWQCYKKIIDYLYDNDKKSLKILENTNEVTKEVFDKYYHKKGPRGNTREFFDFWRIEEILFKYILEYKSNKKLFKIAKYMKRLHYRKYPLSSKMLIKDYKDHNAEIISNKNISLNNKYLKGIYIPKDDLKLRNKILKMYPKIKIYYIENFY